MNLTDIGTVHYNENIEVNDTAATFGPLKLLDGHLEVWNQTDGMPTNLTRTIVNPVCLLLFLLPYSYSSLSLKQATINAMHATLANLHFFMRLTEEVW